MAERHILTDKEIDKAKPAPTGKRATLWDAVTPSLGLIITDKGAKSFIVQRRVNGRMIKLTLGRYPALTLAAAREEARNALKEIARGVDPRQAKPPPVTASGLRRDSFEAAVETYIKRDVEKRMRKRTQDEITRVLRRQLTPRWGTLPLNEIDPSDILDLLDERIDAGAPIAANRTYSILRRFFGWAVERHLLEENPALKLKRPIKEEARARVLSDAELREVWTETERLGWPFGALFRTLILTGQRRNEAAGMRWSEISADGLAWTLPAARTKNARAHEVPLSAPMRDLLAAAPRFEDAGGAPADLVFTTTGATPISGFSRAKARLDATMLAARRKAMADAGGDPETAKPPPNWTLHDLRRTCATGMGRLGVEPHVIEAVLNHMSGFRAGVAGVYQRQSYVEERRRALQAWADHVLGLCIERPANVIPLRSEPR